MYLSKRKNIYIHIYIFFFLSIYIYIFVLLSYLQYISIDRIIRQNGVIENDFEQFPNISVDRHAPMHQERETFEHHSNTLFSRNFADLWNFTWTGCGRYSGNPELDKPECIHLFYGGNSFTGLVYASVWLLYDYFIRSSRHNHDSTMLIIETITIWEMFLWNYGIIFSIDTFI